MFLVTETRRCCSVWYLFILVSQSQEGFPGLVLDNLWKSVYLMNFMFIHIYRVLLIRSWNPNFSWYHKSGNATWYCVYMSCRPPCSYWWTCTSNLCHVCLCISSLISFLLNGFGTFWMFKFVFWGIKSEVDVIGWRFLLWILSTLKSCNVLDLNVSYPQCKRLSQAVSKEQFIFWLEGTLAVKHRRHVGVEPVTPQIHSALSDTLPPQREKNMWESVLK